MSGWSERRGLPHSVCGGNEKLDDGTRAWLQIAGGGTEAETRKLFGPEELVLKLFFFFLLLHVLSAYAAWGYETLLLYSNKSTVPRLSTWVTSPCLWLSVAENLAPRENSDLVNICSLEKSPDDASVTGRCNPHPGLSTRKSYLKS